MTACYNNKSEWFEFIDEECLATETEKESVINNGHFRMEMMKSSKIYECSADDGGYRSALYEDLPDKLI